MSIVPEPTQLRPVALRAAGARSCATTVSRWPTQQEPPRAGAAHARQQVRRVVGRGARRCARPAPRRAQRRARPRRTPRRRPRRPTARRSRRAPRGRARRARRARRVLLDPRVRHIRTLAAMAKGPQVGEPAPDFELPGTTGPVQALRPPRRARRAALLPGRQHARVHEAVLLVPRPPGEMGDLDAVVVGISDQDLDSHEGFTAKHDLTVPLLADADKRVAKLYGVAAPVLGTRRAALVVDEEGSCATATCTRSASTSRTPTTCRPRSRRSRRPGRLDRRGARLGASRALVVRRSPTADSGPRTSAPRSPTGSPRAADAGLRALQRARPGRRRRPDDGGAARRVRPRRRGARAAAPPRPRPTPLHATSAPRTRVDVLRRAGVHIELTEQRRDLMHHKFAVRDDEAVWTGSTNWTLDDFGAEENVIARSSRRRSPTSTRRSSASSGRRSRSTAPARTTRR